MVVVERSGISHIFGYLRCTSLSFVCDLLLHFKQFFDLSDIKKCVDADKGREDGEEELEDEEKEEG